MSREKCKYCKWKKVNGEWESKCTNEASEMFGGECIDQAWYAEGEEECEDRENG